MDKTSWKRVGMRSVLYFCIIIGMFLITFVFVSVGLAIYHSILVEIALNGVFTSLTSGFQITIPLAGIGAISLAFVNHWMNITDRKMKLAEK